MDNLQRSELDSFNRVDDFIIKHEDVLNPIPEFAPEKDKFRAALQSIKDAGIAQTHQSIDHSMSHDAKEKMATITMKYCLRAGVKARALHNLELAKQLEGTENQITNANKAKAIEIATNKRNAMFNNLNLLTNITEPNIAEIDSAIQAYNSIKDAPTIEIQSKKAIATDQLPAFIATANEAVESMYDLIYSYLSETNPELVSKFEEAKQVILTGKHSTSITFDCLADEDDKPIHSFTVNDISKNKVFLSNEEGLVNIEHHRSGKFYFTVSTTARTDVDFATVIKRGTNNHFTVKLKKA